MKARKKLKKNKSRNKKNQDQSLEQQGLDTFRRKQDLPTGDKNSRQFVSRPRTVAKIYWRK